MNEQTRLFYRMVKDFLVSYLPGQKGASEHTVRSYKTAIRQFLDFSCRELEVKMQEFHFGLLTRQHVERFLDSLESDKSCSVSTRNQRLAILKSFCRFASRRDVTVMSCYQNIALIPVKKNSARMVEFFSEEALKAILDAPDTLKRNGKRDRMFMILLYDTGARLQELLGLRLPDVFLDAGNSLGKSCIHVLGKGSKIRVIPLMQKTVEHLVQYIRIFHGNEKDGYLFYVRHKGEKSPLSPDAVEKFIKRYGLLAHAECNDVPEHLYPHMFRHSRAMHLYRNGMSLPLVSEWLGHSQMETTLRFYANANIEMKQEAISKATSELSPLIQSHVDIEIEYDDDTIKRLCGLA